MSAELALGALAALLALATVAAVLMGRRRRRASSGGDAMALNQNTAYTSGMRYATTQVTVGDDGESDEVETVALPSIAIPKTLRATSNVVGATVEIPVDAAGNRVSVVTAPNQAPQEVAIPASAFPKPVSSVDTYLTCPAGSGATVSISIGF